MEENDHNQTVRVLEVYCSFSDGKDDFAHTLLCANRFFMSVHCLHDFAHKQDSQLNSSVLITVWRVVIEM